MDGASRRATWILWALLALGLAACNQHYLNASGGAQKWRIRGLVFQGNEKIPSRLLEAGLEIQPPHGYVTVDWFRYDPITVRLDERRIIAFYAAHGYFEAKVREHHLRRSVKALSPEDVDLVYTIDEGEPTVIGSVSVLIDGEEHVQDQDDTFELTVGDIYDEATYLKGRDHVRDRLRNKGHAFAQVTGRVEVDRDAHIAHIWIRAIAGKLDHFGTVTFEGKASAPESSARARLSFEEGDVFSPNKLTLTQSRLLASGLYGDVRATYPDEEDPSGKVNLILHLGDGVKYDLRLGFGALIGITSGTGDVHTRSSLTIARVGDPLTSLRFDLNGGPVWIPEEDLQFQGSASAQILREDTFLPRLHVAAIVSLARDVFEAYTATGPGVRLVADRSFYDERLLLHTSWQLRGVDVTANSDALGAVLGDPGASRLGTFEEGVTVDLRDNATRPKRGFYLSLNATEGGAFAGGAASYVRLVPEARAYFRLTKRTILALRGKLGVLAGFDGSVAPIVERFYGGGLDQRGFGFHRLSPMVCDIDHDPTCSNPIPIGGNALFETTIEGRFDLKNAPLQIVVFADGGDVTSTLDQLSLAELHWAAGFGLRLVTPIGPLGVDIGFRLNRTDAITDGRSNPDAGSWGAVNLTLGETF